MRYADTAGGTADNTAVYAKDTELGPAEITQAGGLSPYGVMGLAGNVYEWHESQWNGANDTPREFRLVRGGTWDQVLKEDHPLEFDAIAGHYLVTPNVEAHWIGFRVASKAVPEPSSMSLLVFGFIVIATASRLRM